MRAQRKRIVRVALLVGILLGSDANLFATGSRENPSDVSRFVPFYSNRAAPRDVRYSIHVTGRAGATVIELALDNSTIDYVLVKETSTYVEAGQTEAQKAANYWGSGVPASVRAVLDNNTLQEFPLISSTAFSSTVHATFVPGSTNLGTIPAEYFVRGTKICEIPITSYGDDSIVRVLLIHRDGSWERIGLKIEFFQGEKDLFATAGSLPYYKKALGFQYSLFAGSGEEAAFKSAAIKYVTDTGLSLTENDPCWVAFQGANGLSEYQQTFRSVFARHFSFGKELVTLPGTGKSGNVSYVQSGSESFDLIYGKRRSLYMAVYLRFLYERGKPILSKVLNSEMKRLDNGYTYNWKQYEKIPSGPGQDGERLVEAALRYLTWGVEYQLAGETFNVTRNEVFNNNRLVIDEWVSTGSSDGMRNYLPSSVNIGQAIPASPEETAVAALLKTPFGVSRGNPLPYAPQGIDSPRTFAYKMWEQWRVREWSRWNKMNPALDMTEAFLSTFGCERLIRSNGYTEEATLLPFTGHNVRLVTIGDSRVFSPYFDGPLPTAGAKEIITPYANGDETLKPFLPGGAQRYIRSGMENQQPGPFNTDKIAGVDSVGLLSGSLAMATYSVETERLAERVKSLDNEAPADKVQAYYRMQAPAAGLDAKGKPIFYALPGSSDSFLSGGYRFRRADLERATVLVPDVADMRAGDLLVGDNLEEGFRLGIVVGFLEDPPAQVGTTPDQFMTKVLVLSVDRDVRRVYLSRWAGGKFTATPKAFQVRRLLRLKPPNGSVTTGYADDSWELVDTVTSKLSVSIAYEAENTTNGMPRWIPNTGEMLVIHEIRIRKENAWGVGEVFTSDKDTFVWPLPPLDYGFGPAEPGEGSNIYANQGGRIGLFAIEKSKQQLLAIYARSAGSAEYRYDSGLLKYGKLPTEYQMRVDNGVLRFQGPGINATRFGLLAIDDVRPGDDYLLRFGLYDKAGVSTPYSLLTSGTIPDSQAPAVYDKKLLWRANLFLNAGNDDWNVRNPWGSADNTWNRTWTPLLTNAWTFTSETQLPVGGGGQTVSFPAWTRFGANVNMQDTTAYSWGSWDTPFEFIHRMGVQRTALSAVYNKDGQVDPDQTHPRWDCTTAPGQNWANYQRNTMISTAAGEEGVYHTTAWRVYKFNLSETHRYVPGLSTYFAFGAGSSPKLDTANYQNAGNYYWGQVTFSAGVDCSGLAHLASQANALYSLCSEDEKHNSAGILLHSTVIWTELSRDELGMDYDENEVLSGSDIPILPGDILFTLSQNNQGVWVTDHVAVIGKISYEPGTRDFKRGKVLLVEAAAGVTLTYNVKNDQSWWTYTSRSRVRRVVIARLQPR